MASHRHREGVKMPSSQHHDEAVKIHRHIVIVKA
jgi:hypothetical protein